ncbi:uncharacterized protein HMPREF1120_03295 [Exophiala dermatitidis NIH/UT8656]|uniref:Uncharacterized protein n=1 Tax=Exophiala dermatitidis (strain ATCC 34100 / CBS 525.76 / NIH/UT8656) TaxID=858893 RepID=H6BW45_EXODN|nr:uncharacterized protein HMPREF1120_03295 [Exophiala dermatitidis NIH/UT8656]EHY55145.1 hypothetical protein HMPREF1120_03295 [Exophiala dermatitidis NIH/UT8656]
MITTSFSTKVQSGPFCCASRSHLVPIRLILTCLGPGLLPLRQEAASELGEQSQIVAPIQPAQLHHHPGGLSELGGVSAGTVPVATYGIMLIITAHEQICGQLNGRLPAS